MGLLNLSKKKAEVTEVAEQPQPASADKDGNNESHVSEEKGGKDDGTVPEAGGNYQSGVQAMEAVTTVWTKKHIAIAYGMIWLIYFVISIQEVVLRALNPFVVSDFSRHSLTPVVTIISSIVGGLSKLPIGKILDTWGRPQGLALTLLFWVMGIVMMAACRNVETYAAAQVFSSVGAQGVSYCLTIFIADTSSLLNRSLMLAFASSPYIVTPWIGGPVSDRIIAGIGWRWGFGIWTIITPIIVIPLPLFFFYMNREARKAGVLPKESKPLTFQAVKDFIVQFDVLGLLILATGMSLLLLSFSIYSYQAEQWRSALIICFLIFGVVLIGLFILYEIYLAPVKFIPMNLLADRTVLFGGIMFTFIFANSAIWGSYFTSMLMVVWNTGVEKATYISNIYRVGSCFSGLLIGYAVRYTGRFKWVACYFAIPLMMLGVGLMIKFRQPEENLGYIVMTQIFVAFAGGPIVLAGEMAMMTPLEHQHVAAIIAILDLFSSIGTAVGSTVAAAIWTGTFKEALRKHLPTEKLVDSIYGSLYTQLAYKPGTEIRHGISLAYGESQRYMLITSVCLLAGGLLSSFLWRDISLKNLKQVRGNVV
ncbi:unnamed protein product [Clonostachys solani]|uniref:Major facilitator superfamily (MFS) profile domain-containing protein n=1 Tax=Clonostachys solani TaxID=160281 RepID=A0A9P0EQU3_9HYPO|nr:unnamed protein product [Clonostachys solani]